MLNYPAGTGAASGTRDSGRGSAGIFIRRTNSSTSKEMYLNISLCRGETPIQ